MLKRLFYPAIFFPEDDGGFSVFFPDLEGCQTQGETIEEAYEMSIDALGLMLSYLEDIKEPIPSPSAPHEIKIEDGGFLVVVEIDMLEYKKKHGTKSIKKTLTIPEWLNEEAIAKNVNFSQTLQEALIAKCRP